MDARVVLSAGQNGRYVYLSTYREGPLERHEIKASLLFHSESDAERFYNRVLGIDIAVDLVAARAHIDELARSLVEAMDRNVESHARIESLTSERDEWALCTRRAMAALERQIAITDAIKVTCSTAAEVERDNVLERMRLAEEGCTSPASALTSGEHMAFAKGLRLVFPEVFVDEEHKA